MLFAHIGTKLYSHVSKAQEARDRAPPILQTSCLQHHTLKLDLEGEEYMDNNIARGTPGTVSVTPKATVEDGDSHIYSSRTDPCWAAGRVAHTSMLINLMTHSNTKLIKTMYKDHLWSRQHCDIN